MFKSIKLYFLLISILILSACTKQITVKEQVHENMEFSRQQLTYLLDVLDHSDQNPRTVEDGKLKLVKSSDWTSGFFPGCLWYMYEYTNSQKWELAAESYSMNIEGEKMNGRTHDMGFKLFCSFGNGYRLSGNNEFRDILLQGANTLITRFNPAIGCIRSWDHNSDKWDYPVIIDNMLNLELLFWATEASSDSSYYNIAVWHATKTMENHFRADYSTYHVVSYDTITGMPVKKSTHQGYSDDSAWARGQAWGLYGYTMVYRFTRDQKFLEQARHIANFILSHPNLPADGIPYWDFDAPNIPDEPRDVSAAAVICSGLYELGGYVSADKQKEYYEAADKILMSLSSSEYRAELQQNNGFLLKHSVGSYPHDSEIDVPIIYADYYFLEANLRRLNLNDGEN